MKAGAVCEAFFILFWIFHTFFGAFSRLGGLGDGFRRPRGREDGAVKGFDGRRGA